jgi:hypothetical protein
VKEWILGCSWFRNVSGRFLAGAPARSGKSMNRDWIGKRKFVVQFQVDQKTKGANSSYGKLVNWQN